MIFPSICNWNLHSIYRAWTSKRPCLLLIKRKSTLFQCYPLSLSISRILFPFLLYVFRLHCKYIKKNGRQRRRGYPHLDIRCFCNLHWCYYLIIPASFARIFAIWQQWSRQETMFIRSDGRAVGWEDNEKVQMAGMEIPSLLRSPSFLYCSSRVSTRHLWSLCYILLNQSRITVGPLTKLKPKAKLLDRFWRVPSVESDKENSKTYQEKAIPMEVIEIQEHVQPIYKITGTESSCKHTMTKFSNDEEK